MMKCLSTVVLRTYVRRCEVFGQTDHQHYADAVAELERRKPKPVPQEFKRTRLIAVDKRINGEVTKQRITGTLTAYAEEV